jgi:hypothetical protein
MPSETWSDCVVELHEDDESDAQVRATDTEQGTECIEPLSDHDATVARERCP